jgi:NAD-dependent deacetylase
MSYERELERAAELLVNARFCTALTGAGISTPSGIPDFRSLGSGLWEFANPFEVASIYAFRQHPQAFYDWVRPLVKLVVNAEPNPAHQALSELGKMGIVEAVITQNIDGLHQRAQSDHVYEIHGHFRRATCIRCYTSVPSGKLVQAFIEDGEIPRCEVCGGVMKPDIILMGEQLPARVVAAARQASRNSDVMIIAGTSLEVAPASDIPLFPKEHGGKLVFVNLGRTHLDHLADVMIRADVAKALPKLVEAVRALST